METTRNAPKDRPDTPGRKPRHGRGSSTLYFQGAVVNNPLGRSQERGVSDILYIAEK